MTIHLSEALSIPGRPWEYDLTLGFDSFVTGGQTCPITAVSPLRLQLTSDEHKHVAWQLPVEITLQIPCSRCLEPVPVSLTFEVIGEADMGLTEEERIAALDEQSFIQGYELDTDELIRSELSLQIPLKVLCREDCRGLCPVCGTNLNHRSCSCAEGPKDPRMAAILDIFKDAQKK